MKRSCCQQSWLSLGLVALLLVSFSNVVPSRAQEALSSSTELTIDRIFRSDEFREQRVPSHVWSSRSSGYFVLEKVDSQAKHPALQYVDAASGNRRIVSGPEMLTPAGADAPLSIDGFEFSADETQVLLYTNSQRVWRRNTRGDYWLLNLATSTLRKLGGDAPPSSMMFAKFAPSGERVAFVRENNLYVQSTNNLSLTKITQDGSATLINGTSDWVNEEELDIRDGFRWSPDSSSIAYWQFNTEGVKTFTMLDTTSQKYPKTITFPYPKVGEKNSAVRIGVVTLRKDSSNGPTTWLQLDGDPREYYVARLDWLPDGSQLVLQQFNRIQNENRVLLADPASGKTRQIAFERDDAWLENENPLQWIDPGKSYLWLSERDGWRHAYSVSLTGEIKLLTPGEFDVLQIEAVDNAGGWLYFAASPSNATERYLYRVSLQGNDLQPLPNSDRKGWHTYEISPNKQFAIHTYSSFLSPPEIDLIRLADHSIVRPLVRNEKLRENIAKLAMPSAELFTIDLDQSTRLDAWALLPPQLAPNSTYPLLMYVYGEPHGQTVRNAWQGNRGLWHWMLAQQGFVVASVDNRGTMSPKGRAWRKCVHRQIGILASREQATATHKLLQKWPFVDPNRVGVWGWSGGGSMSLNAIFRYPDLYRTAVAVAPVPNQLLYDTIYQERYMGLPDQNADGYRNGSPITFAQQLRGNLLLIHGTGDDNCHYQGLELLMNELIKHNRIFTVLPYPGRSHSISEGTNTARHFHSTITDYLKQNLRDVR